MAADLESYLRLRSGGMSIPVQAHLRDDAWFSSVRDGRAIEAADDDVRLSVYLVRMADAYLARAGRRVVLRAAEGSPGIISWRWLTLCLPVDLLVSALFARDGGEPTTDHVSLTSSHLDRVLENEVALTHLHLGAAFSFSCLWTNLMRSAANAPPLPEDLRSKEGVPFGDIETYLRLLAAATLARLVMARFLMDKRRGLGSFCRFWENLVRVPEEFTRLDAETTSRVIPIWQAAASALVLGTPPPLRQEMQSTYRLLIGSETRAQQQRRLPFRDPLASWLTPERGFALCETRFASRALRHMLEFPDDGMFAELFWQYQRVRNATFRYLIAQPQTSGMDWFQRHYDRIASLRKGLDLDIFRTALEFESEGLGLESLEVRTSPGASWRDTRDIVASYAAQAVTFDVAEGARRPEIGLVLHFLKQRSRGSDRPNADPRNAAFGTRFGPWFHRTMMQAKAMAYALDVHPEMLLVLRGIDAASLELEVPTWALLPIFRTIDVAAVRAAEHLAVGEPSWRAAPLQRTLHVGEDFRRLIDGVRRMHEPIEFGMLRPGDRIGHGIALGLDPTRWCSASRSVPQPAEERLDDLLWELERYRRKDWSPSPQRQEFVKSQILEFGSAIYGGSPAPTIHELLRARRLRHRPEVLETLRYPTIGCDAVDCGRPEVGLLLRYLTDPDVYERGRAIVHVCVDDEEVEMLHKAQAWLRHLLAQDEITIESNPSSNLLVADLDDLENHPLMRLQEIDASARATVMVSINDDDPISFATSLADEFAYIYRTLVRKGLSSQDALAKVDQLRSNGWRSRFTLRASASCRELCKMRVSLGDRGGCRPGTCRARNALTVHSVAPRSGYTDGTMDDGLPLTHRQTRDSPFPGSG